MAQTRPSPTLSRGFTRLGRFLAPDAVVRPVLPFVRSARACFTHVARADGVRSNSRATAPTVLPSSITSRTAPVLNSSVNCRRARLPVFLDSILDIVSTFRNVSTKPDQAQPRLRSVPAYARVSRRRVCHTGGPPLRGGASHEAEGRGGDAGRVGPPATRRRLCVLRQRGDKPGPSAYQPGPGIPEPVPTRIRPEPTGQRLPTGGRVIATPILGGLHHEYRLVHEAA